MSEENVAIVTGGSTGIGAEICRAMLDAGYEVISLARRKPDWTHPRLHAVSVDLLDAAATKAAAAAVAARHQVTHLVHNAGAGRPNKVADIAVEDLQQLTQLHLGAGLILLQAVLPAMKAQRFGRVILMSSRAVLGSPTRSVYTATKLGMVGLARAWALELAADGVTVNAVAPGPIGGTEMSRGAPPDAVRAQGIPVKRIGTPDDVARAVMFFAERANGFVTGQTLFVCGGASIGGIAI
jgi:3-oxoacyl-[acyl-carrier protein] reductase